MHKRIIYRIKASGSFAKADYLEFSYCNLGFKNVCIFACICNSTMLLQSRNLLITLS